MNRIRRHHYVWKHYLRSWATRGQIVCVRGSRVFEVSLENVAHQRDFYTVPELGETEIAFLQDLFIKRTYPVLQELHNGWIQVFQAGHRLRAQLQAQGLLSAEVDEAVSIYLHNAEEKYHGQIEESAKPLLDRLIQGDAEFYREEADCITFAIYICEQFARTRNIKERTLANLDKVREERPVVFF